MKKILYLCLVTTCLALFLAPAAIAQIGNGLDGTLDGLSDYALSNGVDDDGNVFYTFDDTEFSLSVQNDLVKRMDGTALMTEDSIAFVSKLYAVTTGYGDDMETGFNNFFNNSLEELSAEDAITFSIDPTYSMDIEVTGDEAPYNATFSLYLAEIAEEDFPQSIHKKGSDDAPIVIREFADLQCPACKRFHTDTMPYIEELMAEGRVRFEFHHLPLASVHPNAIPAARAIECVSETNGSEGFWTYQDKLFDRQTAWSNLDDPSGYFVRLSDELGLAAEEIESCIEEERYADLVSEAIIKASDLELNSTPSVFVNGYRISNWLDPELFERTMVLATAFAEDSDTSE